MRMQFSRRVGNISLLTILSSILWKVQAGSPLPSKASSTQTLWLPIDSLSDVKSIILRLMNHLKNWKCWNIASGKYKRWGGHEDEGKVIQSLWRIIKILVLFYWNLFIVIYQTETLLLFFLYNFFGNVLCVLLQLVFWWLSVIQSFKRLSENLLRDGFGEIVVNRT